MLFKRKPAKEPLPICFSFEFHHTMDFIKKAFEHEMPENCKSIAEEKIVILDYMLTVIKKDFQYSMLTDILYKYPEEPIEIFNFMPFVAYDERGAAITLHGDCELAFPHISTDGADWANIHTGTKISKVYDFRIALIYEIAKMKYDLTQQQKIRRTKIMALNQLENDDQLQTLSDEDADYIEEMSGFFGITLDQAYQRFVTGNIDGIELDEDAFAAEV